MFTGIIEASGEVIDIIKEGTNINFKIQSPISSELKVDQSVSHNGVCLTIVECNNEYHIVTAVQETIDRTNFLNIRSGDQINLERAMKIGDRLDGHMVQGHVDSTGECIGIREIEGSWYFRFNYTPSREHLLVDKGSICINGVSLTVVEPDENTFSVAIIPYTFEHTNFKRMEVGDLVNLEFDILGKYIHKYAQAYLSSALKQG